MASRNILKTLATEHSALRELFAQMEKTTDRAAKSRAELLGKIEKSLLPHAKWEEAVLYPAFKARADRDGLKTHAEAICEHAAVEDTAIPRVKAAEFATPQFAGRVKVFGELVDHHAGEEEKTMFKMAKKMFSADELAQFDEQYEQWKSSAEGMQVVADAKAESMRVAAGLPAAD